MINVSAKQTTLRRARAEGFLHLNPETVTRVREGTVPKGDVIATARAAGIAAAKRTADWIVFCHPIPLDWAEVTVTVEAEGLRIACEVESVWKTGVEMEALTGVTGALVNAYDMLKPLDASMTITDVQVVWKRGGKSDARDSFDPPLKAAVLVISDSTYAGKREDRSGRVIQDFLRDEPVTLATYEILPDEVDGIRKRVEALARQEGMDLIITTGGTGFGPHDVTPEAVAPLLDKRAPGIVERIRQYGGQRTPYAMLSREIAGTIGETLVLTLPGSSRGCRESLQALFPGVLHIFPMLKGGGHGTPAGSPQ
ncbi:MAG: bifunctional molybdenum cofactor biosynthesis protein MoaC/MoaB [Candidatus Neomarinimicrobiota bacterium]|nr:MAG: bifunctional molybdenum cofactor biosynthesis protein MoaC/MoaB [Candidatus Neomarinimicrobiota bacterium]